MDHVSVSNWQKMTKGKGYKDAGLIKALSALQSANGHAERRLQALEIVAKETEALRKVHKGDGALGGYLDALDKELPKLRKTAQAEIEAAAAESDDDESPAALTTQLVPLLRQVAAGNPMHALLGITGKQVVVLLARRAVSPARRKLISAYAEDASGMKFANAQCVFEDGMHTFVVASKAAGLAKKVKAALLQQTSMRWRVRVRGEDGDVDEEADETEQSEGMTEAAVELKTLTARATSMQPAIQKSLAGPNGGAVKALLLQFAQRVKSGDGAAAQQALTQLEALLAAPATSSAAPPNATTGIPIGKVDYAKCRLAWNAARKKVHGELQALEQAILEHFRRARGFDELRVRIRKLDQVLGGFEENLDGLLDDALNTDAETRRLELHREGAAVVRKFLLRAQQDPLIEQLQNNPFQSSALKPTLVGTLDVLARRLA